MVIGDKNSDFDPVLLLEENLRSYDVMLRLARETHGEILNGEGESFSDNVARRQRIQAEISGRDRIIERARVQLADTRTDQKITDLVKHCAATIAEIQEVDRRTLSLIQKESQYLREGLANLRKGKKAVQGYGRRSTGTVSPRFVDRRG